MSAFQRAIELNKLMAVKCIALGARYNKLFFEHSALFLLWPMLQKRLDATCSSAHTHAEW